MIEKNKIIYLVLGIGIGIIMTNILNSAYPKIEYIQLSEEKIIEKAGELGMVKIKESIDLEKNQKKNKLEAEKEIIEDENDKMKENPEKLEDENIKKKIVKQIVIEEGANLTTAAKLLYKEKLIADEEEFIFFVRGKDLDKKINIGTYDIESDSTYTEIIKIITHRN